MRRLKAQLMGMFSGKSGLPLDSPFLPDSATHHTCSHIKQIACKLAKCLDRSTQGRTSQSTAFYCLIPSAETQEGQILSFLVFESSEVEEGDVRGWMALAEQRHAEVVAKARAMRGDPPVDPAAAGGGGNPAPSAAAPPDAAAAPPMQPEPKPSNSSSSSAAVRATYQHPNHTSWSASGKPGKKRAPGRALTLTPTLTLTLTLTLLLPLLLPLHLPLTQRSGARGIPMAPTSTPC